MAEPIFPLEVWTSQITQASIPANENALRVEVLERAALGIESVEPGASATAENDVYILGPAPSGAQWGSFSQGDVVIHKGGTWLAFSPFEGWLKSVGGSLYVFASGAWTEYSTGGGAAYPAVVSVSSSLSLTKLSHAGKFLDCAHGSTEIVLTVSSDASQGWDAGTEIHVRRAGDAAVSLLADTGVTLQVSPSLSLSLAEKYAVLTLKRVDANTWAVFGYLGGA